MQRPVVEIATTFAGDALALVNGFGRIVTHILMAPVERIANACDVAGILAKRAALAQRRSAALTLLSTSHGPRRMRRRGGGLGCLRFLSELT
jgi:hypothetical protein